MKAVQLIEPAHRHPPQVRSQATAVGFVAVLALLGALAACNAPPAAVAPASLEWVRVSADGSRFVRGAAGEQGEAGSEPGSPPDGAADAASPELVVWGVNYDHDRDGRLIEDYWRDEWETVVEDFREIKTLGANVVRVHLQTAKFVAAPREADEAALGQLARLVALAEETGLYLDITGLGCYHKADVPEWYDALSEADRWDVHALFWGAVARVCAHSPAIFCYDLMNEPILPGAGQPETEWLAGEFAGKHFVQRITLDLAGRTREEVAAAWVRKLVAAIREHDERHMVTVGVIPWAYTFPGAKPIFYAAEAGAALDFVSVHFYPEAGKLDKALAALAVYDCGKPLVVEEMFPLKCTAAELLDFVDRSRGTAEGWISFYWGKTADEYAADRTPDLADAITNAWLEAFRAKAPEVAASGGG